MVEPQVRIILIVSYLSHQGNYSSFIQKLQRRRKRPHKIRPKLLNKTHVETMTIRYITIISFFNLLVKQTCQSLHVINNLDKGWQAALLIKARDQVKLSMRLAASRVLYSSMATVIGPTPPGTGVITDATFTASS